MIDGNNITVNNGELVAICDRFSSLKKQGGQYHPKALQFVMVYKNDFALQITVPIHHFCVSSVTI